MEELFHLVTYTDALLAPSDTPLAYPGCAILLDGQKKLAKQVNSLPISARLKLPFLMQGAKKGVARGQKRDRVRHFLIRHKFQTNSTSKQVEHLTFLVNLS